MAHDVSRSSGGALTSGLKSRQITMISIGGVIGAGLFVGSSAAIAEAGPGVLLSFLIAAVLVVLVMKMLAEMAIANPDTGSFSTYADRALGRWAGFSIGWLYWWFYVLAIPIEAIVAGKIIGSVLAIPSWLPAFAVVVLLAGTNLLAVRSYGEFEYWFALLKVVAIVGFLALGLAAILGLLPGSGASGLSGLWAHGGFLPNGGVSVLAGLLTAMFAFQGSEIVTIAAAESEDPKRNIRKAIGAVVWRLALFYIGSVFVVVALVPWDAPELAAGTYQAALERMNIPGASAVMDLVVLVAVCSCLNSAIYTASRMVFSLARRGEAPRVLGTIGANGTPRAAVLASTGIGVVAVVVSYAVPGLFTYMLASSGAIALIMYLVIAATQLATRRAMRARGTESRLESRMWAFPHLTVLTMVAIAGILLTMAILPGQRLELSVSLGLAAVLVVVGIVIQRRSPAVPVEPRVSAGTGLARKGPR
ncbi:GABA permease [Saccharopolyspora antimicrobica]|uniref:GABA permease n=1 Tax=Saccharopolyspora antimicrobica TaxID=455193 RepID=A0A1I5LXR9_9PSEU|nr:amino acid permease [Saccharopolyspora antimicrobica]RKT89057.1 gamma-aminobutyrate:proton symporter (AAT family) [Saccharopolyspora antimicrobica]SFP02109.1 GABA permease [Saccharopolyspora antimicrobica]